MLTRQKIVTELQKRATHNAEREYKHIKKVIGNYKMTELI